MDQFNTEMIDLKKNLFLDKNINATPIISLKHAMFCRSISFELQKKKIIPLTPPPPPLRPQLNDWAMYAMKLKEFK